MPIKFEQSSLLHAKTSMSNLLISDPKNNSKNVSNTFKDLVIDKPKERVEAPMIKPSDLLPKASPLFEESKGKPESNVSSITQATLMEAPKKVFGTGYGSNISSFGLATADKPVMGGNQPAIGGNQPAFGGPKPGFGGEKLAFGGFSASVKPTSTQTIFGVTNTAAATGANIVGGQNSTFGVPNTVQGAGFSA